MISVTLKSISERQIRFYEEDRELLLPVQSVFLKKPA